MKKVVLCMIALLGLVTFRMQASQSRFDGKHGYRNFRIATI